MSQSLLVSNYYINTGRALLLRRLKATYGDNLVIRESNDGSIKAFVPYKNTFVRVL